MEKYLISLILLFSVSSFAKEPAVDISLPAKCVNEEKFLGLMSKYEELPFLRGDSVREIEKKIYSNPIVMFLDPKTKEWTLIEKIGEYYCFLAVGIKLKPIDNNRERY